VSLLAPSRLLLFPSELLQDSYKKDYEPLLNLTGAMSRCSREKVLIFTQKRELDEQTGGKNVYNWGKGGKLFEQLLNTFSVPSQAPSLG
jgi:hypothetical protein